ncbi:teichoic acid transport system ATP-binding protein [Lachnospiraceae bacterium KH1T2]|nr:teichoic acid transport system ATP-binding protein [Lachnospiraceae bacterium KH1T2]
MCFKVKTDMSDCAIKVENLDKVYKLYDHRRDRLMDALGLTKKKVYHEHYALKDVSMEVHRGETVGIIGTNGSGKSTILKIITGVLNPTAGNVKIDGRISALLELGAGFNMEFTGIENIYLNGTMIGFSNAEIEAKMQDILDFADIGDFVYQPVKTYSSGMFVRLAFAVAINIDPEILIVDEALSVGDIFFQNKCYHKFEEFKKAGKTIVFVSHDLSSISKYCDRVYLLDRGKLLGEGKPKTIIDMYKKVLVHQLDSKPGDNADSLNRGGMKQADGTDNNAVPDLWKNKMTLNPSQDSYGSGLAEIIDFCCVDNSGQITNTIMKGDSFTIRMKVRFNTRIQQPILACSFKNRMGVEITGTNTMFEKIDTGNPEKGEVMVVNFTQNMSLQGGEYLISFGCVGYREGEFTVYHRLYDIFSINVISSKDTVGYYDMGMDTTIEKLV